MLAPNAILQNRYRIIRQLGQGGMGAVYEAIDQRLSSVVAIKETLVETEEMRRAFEREASLLANLRHRALPRVTDHFTEEDGQFLVMEFISGNDLSQLLALRGRPFATAKVLQWADELLKALEYLHSRHPPILHRDIKPANLKLTAEGELFLLDFGLAKGAAGQMSTLKTSRSVVGYTPVYAPLEQITGVGTNQRSDIYSIGATLYHLITGAIPLDAPTRYDAIEDERPDPLRPAHEVNPEVPPAVSVVLTKAMAVSRNQRYASAAEMRRALLEASQSEASNEGREIKEAPPIKSLSEEITVRKQASGPLPPTKPSEEPSRSVGEREKQTKASPTLHAKAASYHASPEAREEAPPPTQPPAADLLSTFEQLPAPVTMPGQPEEKRSSKLWLGLGAAIIVIVIGLITAASLGLFSSGGKENTASSSSGAAPAPSKTSTASSKALMPSGRPLGTLATQSKVYEVAIGPDGKTAASVGDDNVVRLWRVSESNLPIELKGHTQTARSVAISPDGQTVASGSDDQLIRLWRSSDGQLLRTLKGHTDWVFKVAFSPDGQTLVSAGGDKTVHLWRVSDGQLQKTLTTPDPKELIVNISPDLKIVALYNPESKAVRLWSVNENNLLTTLAGQRYEVSGGAFTPDGETLALGSKDGPVRLWRVRDGQLVSTLTGPKGTVGSVAFDPSGQIVAAGYNDGTIWLWKASDGSQLKTLKGHDKFVLTVAFSLDNRVLASGSEDKTIRLWEIAGGSGE